MLIWSSYKIFVWLLLCIVMVTKETFSRCSWRRYDVFFYSSRYSLITVSIGRYWIVTTVALLFRYFDCDFGSRSLWHASGNWVINILCFVSRDAFRICYVSVMSCAKFLFVVFAAIWSVFTIHAVRLKQQTKRSFTAQSDKYTFYAL